MPVYLNWSGLLSCDIDTVRANVRPRGGVYRLLSRGADGKFFTFYVGRAEDLQERLVTHFSATESNKRLSKTLEREDCRFKFAYDESERERAGIERYLIDLLPDLINTQSPDENPIQVNLR